MASRGTPHEAASSMLDPIPTYTEATASPHTTASTLPQLPPEDDSPPDYAVLDASQTTFSIYGTFIHNASGPAFQLSSPFDQRGASLRIRRLRAREVHQVGSAPLAFDKSYVLYEAHDPPLLDNEYHVLGKRRHCLPGVLELKFRLRKWRVVHVPRPGAKGTQILTCKKVGAHGSAKLRRRREMEASRWKDAQGRVVATETLGFDEAGNVVPTVELGPELDQTWRELLLMMWVTRLWAAFGVERTPLEERWSRGWRLAVGMR